MKKYKYLSPWTPSNKHLPSPPIVVVTCFIQKDEKILVLQRAKQDIQYKLWGIPGGKLKKNEDPLKGLLREIKEEISQDLTQNTFLLLGTARSQTLCDGEYGLYLYHTFVSTDLEININLKEHSAYRWVTLEEFESLDLLTAQGEAYRFVEGHLKNLMHSNLENIGEPHGQ